MGSSQESSKKKLCRFMSFPSSFSRSDPFVSITQGNALIVGGRVGNFKGHYCVLEIMYSYVICYVR